MVKRDGYAVGGVLRAVLFAAAWLVFGWPLVTVPGQGPGLFAYLFLAGGGVVAALWWTANGRDADPDRDGRNG